MNGYVQIVTIFASGAFALLVTVVTVALTGYNESRAERRTLTREKKTQLEVLYVDNIAIFEKCIRYTELRESFRELFDDMARVNARMRLASTMEVIQESEAASDLLYQWSREYAAGLPKPIGDSNLVMISSQDSPTRNGRKNCFHSFTIRSIR
jgi:hypothetical protein